MPTVALDRGFPLDDEGAAEFAAIFSEQLVNAAAATSRKIDLAKTFIAPPLCTLKTPEITAKACRAFVTAGPTAIDYGVKASTSSDKLPPMA